MADTRILPQDKHVDSRDFRIVGITFINAMGVSQDISKLCIELQVRQDMFLGFMNGEVLINDAIDIHTQFAMHGNEYLLIHIQEPGKTLAINKAFRIYKISDRVQAQTGSSQRYILYFVSDELLQSQTMKISKGYQNTTVSDMVADILQNYLQIPSNQIILDRTGTPVSVVIPNYRPVEAINWLASRAHERNDTCWFFYENLDGYNFRSVQALYRDPPAFANEFKLESKKGDKNIEEDKFTIDDFEVKKDFDALAQAGNGGNAMRLLQLNPMSQSFESFDYSQEDLETMHGNPAMSNPKNLFGKAESHLMCYIDSMGTSNWVKRTMTMTNLNNSLIQITVPGNMLLQAGRTISIKLPYSTIPSEGDMWDERKSGKYLILAVNLKFDLLNHRYVSILLLGRDSVPVPLPTADTKLPDKIRQLNANPNKA
jgi:hypothetical protein